jgi:hypothetical protein
MFRAFLRSMPESALRFDVDRMVRDAQGFTYGVVSPGIARGAWVPSYIHP